MNLEEAQISPSRTGMPKLGYAGGTHNAVSGTPNKNVIHICKKKKKKNSNSPFIFSNWAIHLGEFFFSPE
jgi:hypothetical protein